MTNSTFDRWVLGAAGLIALLVAAAALTFQNTRELNDVAWWVAHTHEVMDAIEVVHGRLRESEAAQRTFLVVGGDRVPPEFAANIDAAKSALAGAKTLTADNAEHQARFPDLEKRINELAAFWAGTMTVRQEQGFDAARQIVAAGESRRMMAELDEQFQGMSQVERELLRSRTEARDRTYGSALTTGLLSGLAGVIGVIAFMALLRRYLTKRAADAAVIAEQGERLRTTLASIGDAVIATDIEGRVTGMNPVAESLTGWTVAAASGRPLVDVFRIENEETRRPVESPAERVLREGVIVGLANHTILIAQDGAEHPIDDSAAPIRCQDGQIVGCVLVFRDVTQRRRLERENAGRLVAARTLASIVESSEDAIIGKSLDGVIQSWNAGAERLFGYTAEQAVGRPISLIIPADRRSEEDRIIAALKAGQRVEHFETVRLRSDGSPVWVSLTISPIKDDEGRIIGASKVARDVTERRRMEDNLRRMAADLSDADRRKDEFLATLAHELRNPLAPIRNALEVLGQAPSPEERERARTVMQRQLAQMVRLVDDLLDVSRITRGKLDLRRERVPLSAVVGNAVETSRPMIDHLGHTLSLDLPEQPIYVDADLTRLAQVFANLLNNGAKYMDRGGQIRLSAELAGDEVIVSVKDTGIGIAADQLTGIFEMFSQVDDSLKRSQGGLGIGLTLVKRLVEMHGGSIEAKSDGLGKGAEFVVRLPVAAAAAGPHESNGAPEPTSPRSSLRILVVDDNRDNADSLVMLLGLMGNDTRTAYDGEEGLAAAREFRPDVMLLDIGLPKVNGFEACRQIRAEPWGEQVVLIAVTGWGQDDDRRRSRDAGFDHHLVKPVKPQDLMALLAELRHVPT